MDIWGLRTAASSPFNLATAPNKVLSRFHGSFKPEIGQMSLPSATSSSNSSLESRSSATAGVTAIKTVKGNISFSVENILASDKFGNKLTDPSGSFDTSDAEDEHGKNACITLIQL